MRSQFVRTVALGFMLLFCSLPVSAVDLYGTPQGADSVLQSARPGEYYYNLGADAVRHKDYAHAVEMYKVSASWAYKTSEYNLGVMYARGEGVAVDLPRAMAWMALAAERNDKEYVQARDLIASTLDKNGIAQAEAILKELLPTYGDAVALNRAKTQWRGVRNEATGSHVGFTGNVQVTTAGGQVASGAMQGTPELRNAADKFLASGKEQMIESGRSSGIVVRETGSANSGAMNAAELTGTRGVDGAKAYADLRMTDNPYDPRFSSGVATVGPLTPVGEKKPSGDEPKKDPASQPDGQQKQ
jgi:TPR repeat protein